MRESLGKYETRRRSESKGQLSLAEVGSARSTLRAAHYRPVSIVASMRRRESVHVGTRKMVNYA